MSEDCILFESPTKYVEWRIKNFFDLPTNNNCESSCSFSVSGAKWFLRIYPNGDSEDKSVGWISLYLFKQHSSLEYHVSFRIGIQNFDGSEFKFFNYDPVKYPVTSYGYGATKCVERSSLLRSKKTVAPDGFLTVICSLRICKTIPLKSSVETASQTLIASNREAASQTSDTSNKEVASQTFLADDTDTLHRHFKDMYLKKRLTDVTIAVKSREFLAHKFILASQSSVFASMFENDMAEAKSGRIEIPDCDPDSFEEFLLFLYTGKWETESFNNGVNLYNISDKYDVKELKNICKDVMKRQLSIDSICDVIHLSTMHFEIDLLTSATDFFIKNADSILSTTKWHMFLEENPALGNELFLKVLKSKKS